ncbi:MAG: FoF1 ATP synthase subunit gamma [Nitrospirota bacterium]
MISSRELENRRKSNKSILGVVKAMKALSAANVRKGGTVLEHTRRYREFVDRAASRAASLPGVSILPGGENTLIVAFGSQYGLCGALNERVLEDVAEAVVVCANMAGVIYAGRRIADRAPALSTPVEVIDAPGSVDGLDEMVSELLTMIYKGYKGEVFGELLFIYPSFTQDALTVIRHLVLPPPFRPEEDRELPPLLYISPADIMEGVLEEYIYVQLYATALETVIAENESRMRSMDYAEKNIKKRIEELSSSYNYALQEEVTGEILEIIGGYEALGGNLSGK